MHTHLLLKPVEVEQVAADHLGNGRAPVARADDGNLLLLLRKHARTVAMSGSGHVQWSA